MTEDELLSAVTGCAAGLGVSAFHVPDSRRVVTGRGFPDLVLVGRRCLFAELKSADGELSPDQVRWKYKLIAAGQRWVLWRPADWPGRIKREIKEIA